MVTFGWIYHSQNWPIWFMCVCGCRCNVNIHHMMIAFVILKIFIHYKMCICTAKVNTKSINRLQCDGLSVLSVLVFSQYGNYSTVSVLWSLLLYHPIKRKQSARGDKVIASFSYISYLTWILNSWIGRILTVKANISQSTFKKLLYRQLISLFKSLKLIKIPFWCSFHHILINSLWPSDAKLRNKSGSIMAREKASCLTVLSKLPLHPPWVNGFKSL